MNVMLKHYKMFKNFPKDDKDAIPKEKHKMKWWKRTTSRGFHKSTIL